MVDARFGSFEDRTGDPAGFQFRVFDRYSLRPEAARALDELVVRVQR